MVQPSPDVRVATTGELDPVTLYGILRLRSEVFVIEQACVYRDLDGRDLEPDCRHLWIEDGETVVASLRLLVEPNVGYRIGRVATAPGARRRGLAQALVARAVELADGPVVLDAQSHLVGWYETLGFEVAGEDFVEDGIPHTPMRRP